MGTGDCFALKFFKGEELGFKMMIDCGTWSGAKAHLEPYIIDLKTWFDNEIDLLVITHEHKDHVYGFEACEHLFTADFNIKETWMAWTEDDQNPITQDWMKDYGQKKLALAIATERIRNFVSDEFNLQVYDHEFSYEGIVKSKQAFSDKLNELTDFQFSVDKGAYVGNLKGMKIVKEKLAKDKILFKEPGQIYRDLEGLPGVNIYVLGPPKSWKSIKKESGGKGESYTHNTELFKSDAFAAAILEGTDEDNQDLLPFDKKYIIDPASERWVTVTTNYKNDQTDWRNIDFDWLMGAGELGLRVASMTNNLSLALAIEFQQSKKVMLFPGDAEYGSWASWHDITWDSSVPRQVNPDKTEKGVIEDLLNRTVFYKVAHHLSHNGTARRLGLEMMTHQDLVAMATLDYEVISSGWTSTMPNVELIAELVKRTKGRLVVMNENNILADRTTKETLTAHILKGKNSMSPQEKEQFAKNIIVEDLYAEYTLIL